MPKKFESPFSNDPFAIVMQAFRNLYLGKECSCWFDPEEITDGNGDPAYGYTEFFDDGEVLVRVSSELKVSDAVEVLAHELAHVAVGMDENGHGAKFDAANQAIFDEYHRIVDSLIDIDSDEESEQES